MTIHYELFATPYHKFRDTFLSIGKTRDAALIATIYCGYARVGEIVRGRYSKNPPLNKDAIEFTDTHMILSIKTEKTNRWRQVASNRSMDGWLHKPIHDWLDICGFELFPISTRWAEKIFLKWFGTENIHMLRHWACSHALQGKRSTQALQAQEVAKLGGWSTLDSFYRTYAHFTTTDFIYKI